MRTTYKADDEEQQGSFAPRRDVLQGVGGRGNPRVLFWRRGPPHQRTTVQLQDHDATDDSLSRKHD